MADNVVVTPGTGNTVAADEVVDATLGTVKVQFVKLMDGTLDGTSKVAVSASGLKVDLGADNDVTVTGTVDLGATDNAVLDAIAAKDFATQTTLALVKAKTDNIPALGQALAAASVPVVLTAAQITTLTPPTPQTDALTDTQLRATAVPVSLASVPSHAVTNAGTFAVQGTCVGTVADDATTPGAPVMIGGQAKETDGTDPGSVSAEDDVVRAIFDRNRRQLVNNVHPNHFVLFEDHTAAQTNNQLKAAPGAGLSIYITDVIFSNGATAGSIKLVEDESGTPVQIGSTIYMAINGGAVMNFITPKRLTANKTLGFTSATVTTHSVEIHGYIAP